MIAAFTITPSAGANGSISPNTVQTVTYGATPSFTITPVTAYHVADVLVDGTSVGAVTTYTFPPVIAGHTISASFAINTYTITTTPGANGTITPANPTINSGANQAFTITPDAGYHIVDVLVDSASLGALTSYTFTNVTANHTISASFAINSTSTNLISSSNPSTFGVALTFTATVASAFGTPTGTVTFSDGGTTIGTGTLSAGVATFSTSTLTSGSHSITAAYSGDTNFAVSTSSPLIQTVNVTNQATLTVIATPSTVAYGSTSTLSSSGGSGTGVVTFSAGASTGCSVAGTTLSVTNASGTCLVTATKAADTNYTAATSAPLTITLQKIGQTITVGTHAPASAAYNSQFTVAATASSLLPVAITTSGGCSGSGSGSATITMTSGTTSCTINYNQAGDTNYVAATPVTENTTAGKISQTITVGTHTPASAAYNSQFTVAATASSLLPVAITTSGGCSGSGSGSATITMTSGTTSCTVNYNQAGDTNYVAATPVTENTTAGKISQTITVGTHAPASAAYNSQFTVAATASSLLPVAITTSGGCSGSGSGSATITMTSGTTSCTVNYNQAGDTNYVAATPVTENTTAGKISQTITVGTHAPASAAYNSQFTVAATASSLLPVAITTSGGCSGSGSGSATITMTSGTTSCTVNYNQAGDTNYVAATPVSENTTATKIGQTITVGTPAPATAVNNSQFTVAATAPGGTVSITTLGSCTGTGSGSATITITSDTGICTVLYGQVGNNNYEAAPQVTSDTTALP